MASRRQAPMLRTVLYVLTGAALTALLLATKIAFESTAAGRAFEHWTYGRLLALLPQHSAEGQSVVVVDISQIPGGTLDRKTGRPVPTSRAVLKETLDVLRALQPSAIALDIDFSPDTQGWIDAGDPKFFDHCLAITNDGIPVTLGVFRSMREPPSAWLGTAAYAAMAGAMYLPRGQLERIPISVRDPARDTALPSIGFQLAQSWNAHRPPRYADVSDWIGPYSERLATSPVRRDGLLLREVLVNHAGINQMKSETIRYTEPRELRRHAARISGRMVLLGAADEAGDLFEIPGQPGVTPGVYAHASAAYTLASEPVYEFTHRARFVLDVGISMLMLACVVVAGRRFIGVDDEAVDRVQRRVLWWTSLVVVGAGAALVLLMRVMWLDFVLVVVFLLLHRRAEQWMHERGT